GGALGDGGPEVDSGTAATGGHGNAESGDDGSCGCRVGAESRVPGGAGALGFALLGLAGLARRRR
ncbi:MAG: MYXO-CTERM sorting domain-containing protein, partial [Sorangiineae bacterium]|nr:MYXO-CTERM sorting domain-containing protein [Sorangiineae bacterium]